MIIIWVIYMGHLFIIIIWVIYMGHLFIIDELLVEINCKYRGVYQLNTRGNSEYISLALN